MLREEVSTAMVETDRQTEGQHIQPKRKQLKTASRNAFYRLKFSFHTS